MTMNKLEKFNAVRNPLTRTEEDVLEIAYNIFGELLDNCGRNTVFQSPINGDLVSIDELCRARGIISFFLENAIFEIKK